MARNLVFLHLESISNTILWQYRVELGTVWRMANESLFYTRHVANATSTQMAMYDVLLGNSFINDYSSHYSDKIPYPLKWGLVSTYLRNMPEKYDFRVFYLDYYRFEDKLHGEWRVINDPQRYLDEIWSFITDAKNAGRPFGLLLYNEVSHMALQDAYKASATSFSDRFRRSYQSLDIMIGRIVAMLEELGVMDNTTIVGYGDHGDEFWSHGLNRGFCHCLPPYASLTCTPLFIYEKGAIPATNDQLACSMDIRETVIKRLYPDYAPPAGVPPFDNAPFSGIDLNSGKREFAFSQNLYALQLEYDDPERALSKGYSVTDGIYRLVVTSGGGDKREGGLELFCDRLDPFNSRNLLDFFGLDPRGGIASFKPPSEAVSPEFSLMFNPLAVEALKERYHTLKRVLYDFIREKEAAALPYSPGEPRHIMPEKVFTYARRRQRRE